MILLSGDMEMLWCGYCENITAQYGTAGGWICTNCHANY